MTINSQLIMEFQVLLVHLELLRVASINIKYH